MLPLLAIPAALIAGLLGYAATRPGTFRVQRTTRIAAAPERIAPFITDFHRWAEWSPYEKMDPELKKTFSGAESGPGAAYAWEGKKTGIGRMEILEVAPHRVCIKLDFEKPFKANNTAEFTFTPTAGVTTVTWAIDGPQPFVSKLMGVFINMDRMIGRDFETGLANLKAVAEG